MTDELMNKLPGDWTLEDIQRIELPVDYFCLTRVDGGVIEYHVSCDDGELAVETRCWKTGWKFTLDRGFSWLFFDSFDDLPEAVREWWHVRVAQSETGEK